MIGWSVDQGTTLLKGEPGRDTYVCGAGEDVVVVDLNPERAGAGCDAVIFDI